MNESNTFLFLKYTQRRHSNLWGNPITFFSPSGMKTPS